MTPLLRSAGLTLVVAAGLGAALIPAGPAVAANEPGPMEAAAGGAADGGHRGPGDDFGRGFGRGPGLGHGPGFGRPPFGIDFAAIDADESGGLSRAELIARATARLTPVDTNGDGSLDRAELIVVMSDDRGPLENPFGVDPGASRADRLLALLGASAAGRFTVVEFSERQSDRVLAAFDVNRDGAVSEEEIAVQRQRMPHPRSPFAGATERPAIPD